MNWLKQPSTIRGIFLFMGVFGWNLRPELQDAIITFVTVGLALVEVIRNEHAPTPIKIELPPIELIGQAEKSAAENADAMRRDIDERMHRALQSGADAEPAQPNNNWNG